MFDAFLEVLQLQQISMSLIKSEPDNTSNQFDESGFLHSTCRQLLDMPYTRKGRYLPLSSLIKAKGALWVLEMQPDLIRQTFLAMQVSFMQLIEAMQILRMTDRQRTWYVSDPSIQIVCIAVAKQPINCLQSVTRCLHCHSGGYGRKLSIQPTARNATGSEG